ncbi:tRNA pseudouridine synthase A [Pseudokineococcus basanitobsidens]|uniref:tRNA pseudouridine synthase A n=1 Tax=Pseudokineococcus basanitobsidens TaxID=1926649 RepID=UPI003BB7F1E2
MPSPEPGAVANAEARGGVVRVRLDLAYDGAGFSGWAAQPGRRTVEGELTAALSRVLRSAPPRLVVAGRTDAGVSARGQAAHLDLPADSWRSLPGRSGGRPDGPAPGEALVRRLAGVLPEDVVVRSARPAPPGFDARFGALSRRYAYRVADGASARDPLRRGEVLAVRRRLDAAAMDRAAGLLLGEHDWLPFCRPREGASTVRTLLRHGWTREEGGVLVADVEADAFCHHMVRSLVGACLAVGEGRRDEGWPARVLAAGVRDPAVAVVPARGLVLEEVRYPDDEALAAQARRARTRRGPVHAPGVTTAAGQPSPRVAPARRAVAVSRHEHDT